MRWIHFILLLGLCAWSGKPADAGIRDACVGVGTAIVVELERNKMYLCRNNRIEEKYRVALGRGGFGKTKRGDLKTPRGTYGLDVGRSSDRFYRFLGVGYPTKKQKSLGYTGSAIGVHGPERRMGRLGWVSRYKNWTAGCIAVGTVREIDSIDAWVRKHGARRIHLQ